VNGGAVLSALRKAVTDEMLARRHHAVREVVALQAADVRHAEVAHERVVFAEGFFDASPARVARNVQHRSQ
jgi:hypothetical protein